MIDASTYRSNTAKEAETNEGTDQRSCNFIPSNFRTNGPTHRTHRRICCATDPVSPLMCNSDATVLRLICKCLFMWTFFESIYLYHSFSIWSLISNVIMKTITFGKWTWNYLCFDDIKYENRIYFNIYNNVRLYTYKFKVC